MKEYDQLVNQVEKTGTEIFWQGGADADQIDQLESLLSKQLPPSFRRFLIEYGGGGPIGAEISGIEDNDVFLKTGGTVLGDTEECRSRYNLPSHLIAIYFHDDEVCWCLDSSNTRDKEYPVVSYNLFTKKIDKNIGTNFHSFMTEHLKTYSNPSE